jgi:PAS domain S-box-containing protein
MHVESDVMTQGLSLGGCILIVEDEALLAEELRQRLTRLGYTVVGVVDSSAAAVAAAERVAPDLVLMDIRLKGGDDGANAADAIRRRTDVPVVFLTAHSDPETLARATGAGPYGYVLKPFREQDVVVAIVTARTRHALERRIVESERRHTATLASVADGVIATDAAGQVTFMNRVAEALTGWPNARARGVAVERVLPLISEASGQPVENSGRQAMRERRNVSLAQPTLLVTDDGIRIPVDDTAAPIVDERGSLLGSVIAFRDDRERRRREDALLHAEQQLHHARRMEAVGQLAGGIAHDFNNLLTVVIGASDVLLAERTLTSSQRDWVQDIRKAGIRAANLTRQLLAFSRKQVLQLRALDLGALVTELAGILQRLIGEHVALAVSTTPDRWAIQADPSQIEQIMLNLAANARDAISGVGRVSIDVRNVELAEPKQAEGGTIPAGAYVCLSVRDTGTGMDAATRTRIFEPFFTTKDVGKGTGLGLASVYGIVRQSDGFIAVASELGTGTTFEIYFPAIRLAQMDDTEGGLIGT